MIFGAKDLENHYLLQITVDGRYRVRKGVKNEFETIKDWEKSNKLIVGFDKMNFIKVIRSGTVYSLYFNGDQIYQFTDSSIKGDKIGYFVYVVRDESFPNTPVDVRFKKKGK